MSLVQSRFASEECRVEYGIYFPNDAGILLSGRPAEGYKASAPVSVLTLVTKEPNRWTPIDEQCHCKSDDVSIAAGGTSWEGDGFIAVSKGGKLVWLLHVEASEVFHKVAMEGDGIIAQSSEYPFTWNWKIPLGNPALLEVSRAEQ